MTRTSAKSKTAEKGMEMILATEPLRTVVEAAEFVGVAEIRLLELFSEALNQPEALGWEVIPQEHHHLLNQFRAQASSNTQVLLESSLAPVPDTSKAPVETPLAQEDQTPTRRRGRPKKESTALTQPKSSKLKESDQKSQQLASTDQQVKVALHARKGQKSGAQLATIELAAEDLTYRKIKGEALLRKTAQLTSEIASESNFDPIQLLKDLGIDSNSEIFEDLRGQLEPALGKLESSTAEIVETAWVNGIDLETELGKLEDLLNSSGSIPDYWQ
jgi:hypothetical protein